VEDNRVVDILERFRKAYGTTTARFFDYTLENDVWIEMHARGLTDQYGRYGRPDCKNDAGRGEYLAKTIMEFYNIELTRARVLARLRE